MAKAIKNIELSFRCKQNFEAMPCANNSSNNRHCSQCNKTVFDFTKSNDAEMQEVIETHGNSICGRFNISQMSKNYLVAQAASLGITLGALYGCNDLTSHIKPRRIVGALIKPKPNNPVVMGKPQITTEGKLNHSSPIIVADSNVINYLNTEDLTTYVAKFTVALVKQHKVSLQLYIKSNGRVILKHIKCKGISASEQHRIKAAISKRLNNIIVKNNKRKLLDININ
jgi:hypothetical protein